MISIEHNGNEAGISSHGSLMSEMELPLKKSYFPLGFGIELYTNSAEVLAAADESFVHRDALYGDTGICIRVGVGSPGTESFLPEPVRREYNHLYSLVADPQNQALLDLQTGENFVWLTENALRSRLYLRHNFLEKVVYLLLGASVVTDLHAGCVSKEGKGLLLCGPSGAGKSTLSYACARKGWIYTSDDTSYLVNDSNPPRVIGHSHRVRFRPQAKLLFPELQGRSVTPRMEGKPSMDIPLIELPPVQSSPEAVVHAILYLKRDPSAAGRLVRLPDGAATSRLNTELYSAGEIRRKHERILSKLTSIPTFELEYSETEQAIEQMELLSRCL